MIGEILRTEVSRELARQIRRKPAAFSALDCLPDDGCRAVSVMAVYTMLLNDDCGHMPEDMVVSMDHVVLEACREAGIRRAALAGVCAYLWGSAAAPPVEQIPKLRSLAMEEAEDTAPDMLRR